MKEKDAGIVSNDIFLCRDLNWDSNKICGVHPPILGQQDRDNFPPNTRPKTPLPLPLGRTNLKVWSNPSTTFFYQKSSCFSHWKTLVPTTWQLPTRLMGGRVNGEAINMLKRARRVNQWHARLGTVYTSMVSNLWLRKSLGFICGGGWYIAVNLWTVEAVLNATWRRWEANQKRCTQRKLTKIGLLERWDATASTNVFG